MKSKGQLGALQKEKSNRKGACHPFIDNEEQKYLVIHAVPVHIVAGGFMIN